MLPELVLKCSRATRTTRRAKAQNPTGTPASSLDISSMTRLRAPKWSRGRQHRCYHSNNTHRFKWTTQHRLMESRTSWTGKLINTFTTRSDPISKLLISFISLAQNDAATGATTTGLADGREASAGQALFQEIGCIRGHRHDAPLWRRPRSRERPSC